MRGLKRHSRQSAELRNAYTDFRNLKTNLRQVFQARFGDPITGVLEVPATHNHFCQKRKADRAKFATICYQVNSTGSAQLPRETITHGAQNVAPRVQRRAQTEQKKLLPSQFPQPGPSLQDYPQAFRPNGLKAGLHSHRKMRLCIRLRGDSIRQWQSAAVGFGCNQKKDLLLLRILCQSGVEPPNRH